MLYEVITGGIEHHVTRLQLHRLDAERAFDLQFSTVIFLRLGQEQGGRKVAASYNFV